MIELKNITKKFNNNIVLDNLNYKFSETGLYVINGDNGSGKTTLSYIIGLLDNKYEGKFYFNHVDVSKLSKKEYNQAREKFISYIFSKNNLIPYFLNYLYVALTRTKCNLILGIYTKEDKLVIDSQLQKLGIYKYKKINE